MDDLKKDLDDIKKNIEKAPSVTQFISNPRSVIKQILEEIDVNNNGVIEIKEVFSKHGLKVIFGVLISVVFGLLINYLKTGLITGNWDPGNMMDVLEYIVPIMFVTWLYKVLLQEYDDEKEHYKKKIEEIRDSYEERIAKLKDKILESRTEELNAKAEKRLIEERLKWMLENNKK